MAAEHPVYNPGGESAQYSLGSSNGYPYPQYPPPYESLDQQQPQQPYQQFPSGAPDAATMERFGGFLPPIPQGNYAIGFGALPQGGYDGLGGGPPGASYGPGGYGPGPNGAYGVPGGQPPPYGYPDPSFSTQTGFEGLLVSNPIA